MHPLTSLLQFAAIATQCLLCFRMASSLKQNVLFLVADDMRPELGSYDGPDSPSPVHPKLFTPNLDALATKSLLLKRAYVQQAVCSPSRTSLLTSRRPDTTHVYTIGPYFRDVGGNFTTLPQYFKEHGYRTIGLGKIFHPGHSSGGDDPISWTDPYYHAPNEPYWTSRNASWEAVPSNVREEKPLPDEQLAFQAISLLEEIAKSNKSSKPFFLALGFHKPHLPFVFPEEFLNPYPQHSVRVPDNPYAPVDMPELAWSKYNELRAYKDIAKLHASGEINTTLPDPVVRDLRRAYYASVSFTDALIGLVLKSLDALGLANTTVISFWGDHGWQLGEHGEWCKHTNFELATHAPMMIHIPGVTDHGVQAEALTEFVDLYPTLVEATGLPTLPMCPTNGSSAVHTCTEGQSLIPLINGTNIPWKQRVFSQYPRKNGRVMGYSMRTDRFRYTEWVGFHGKPVYKPDWKIVYGIELYDHETDPEENVNVVNQTSYVDTVRELHKELLAGWRAAYI